MIPSAGSTAALEIVGVASTDSFKVWSHGYPYRTVRWHFHPEYELHLITETSGRYFVGDHIGAFQTGNLVLTGPNLPHNWISDIAASTSVPRRCLVLQFTAAMAEGIAALFPELRFLSALLDEAGRGLLFSPEAGAASRPILEELLTAPGSRRIELFFALIGILRDDGMRRPLASVGYQPKGGEYMTRPLNHALAHIRRNLAGDLRETDLAALCGYSPSAFSRAFRRHTGMSFIAYVNSLRINHACEMLIQGHQRVTDICFEAGFNNLSNFNRQFLAQKAMSPSTYRSHHAQQASGAIGATGNARSNNNHAGRNLT